MAQGRRERTDLIRWRLRISTVLRPATRRNRPLTLGGLDQLRATNCQPSPETKYQRSTIALLSCDCAGEAPLLTVDGCILTCSSNFEVVIPHHKLSRQPPILYARPAPIRSHHAVPQPAIGAGTTGPAADNSNWSRQSALPDDTLNACLPRSARLHPRLPTPIPCQHPTSEIRASLPPSGLRNHRPVLAGMSD